MLYNRNQGFQRYLNGNQVIQGIQEIKYPVNPQFPQNPTPILHSTQTNPQQMNFNNILIPINHLGPSPANANQQINFPIPTDKILIPMNPQINFSTAVGANPLSLQQQFISNNDLSLQPINFPLPADKSPTLPKFSPQQGNKKSFGNQQRNTFKRKILKITPSIKVISDFNDIFQFGKRLIFEFKTGEMYIGELHDICHYFHKLELINCIMLRGPNDNNKINLMKNLRSTPIPFFIMEIHLIHHKIPGLNFDDFYFGFDEEKQKTEDLDTISDIKVMTKKDPSSSSSSSASSTTTKEDLTWNDSIKDAEVKSVKSTTQLNVNAAEFKPSGLPMNNAPAEIEKTESVNSLREVDLKPLITKFISRSNIEKIEKALKGIIKISQWTSKEDFGIAIDNINSEIEIAANFEFQRAQHVTPHTLQIYAPKLNKIFIFDKKSTQSRCIRNIFENSKIRKIIHFTDQIKRSLKNELKCNTTNFVDTYVMFSKLYPSTEDENTKKNGRKLVTLLEMIEIVLNVKNDYIEFANDIHAMNLNIKKKLIIGKMVVFLYEIYVRLFHEQYYRILFSSNFTVIDTSKGKDETVDKTKDTKEDKKKNKNKSPSHFEYNFKGNFDLNNKSLGVAKNEFQVNYKIPKKFLKKP